MKKYIAIDQYGKKEFVDTVKELSEISNNKHIDKMYQDKADGTACHVGYVIGGHWWTLLRISPLQEK
jgi:hypothetical protein